MEEASKKWCDGSYSPLTFVKYMQGAIKILLQDLSISAKSCILKLSILAALFWETVGKRERQKYLDVHDMMGLINNCTQASLSPIIDFAYYIIKSQTGNFDFYDRA